MNKPESSFLRFMKRVADSAEFKDKLNTALFGLSVTNSATLLSRIGKTYGYDFEPEEIPGTFLEELVTAGQITEQQIFKFSGVLQVYTAKQIAGKHL